MQQKLMLNNNISSRANITTLRYSNIIEYITTIL